MINMQSLVELFHFLNTAAGSVQLLDLTVYVLHALLIYSLKTRSFCPRKANTFSQIDYANLPRNHVRLFFKLDIAGSKIGPRRLHQEGARRYSMEMWLLLSKLEERSSGLVARPQIWKAGDRKFLSMYSWSVRVKPGVFLTSLNLSAEGYFEYARSGYGLGLIYDKVSDRFITSWVVDMCAEPQGFDAFARFLVTVTVLQLTYRILKWLGESCILDQNIVIAIKYTELRKLWFGSGDWSSWHLSLLNEILYIIHVIHQNQIWKPNCFRNEAITF